MKIQDMFSKDINRKINIVVTVEDDKEYSIVQELDEYVITRELKKHFATFFNSYEASFHEGTRDIGVWISGFYGSGKSHFLKMLSYLLSNKTIQGVTTVERFRNKFDDDPATFMKIDASTRGQTDTLLFNIQTKANSDKGEGAITRVLAKMFYNHWGFYGENLKIVELEKHLFKNNKLEAFKESIKKNGDMDWEECRKGFAFWESIITASLVETLDMSEEAAREWVMSDESTVKLSIESLIEDIQYYMKTKPDDYRLVFMIDEAGQFIGDSKDFLLSLQTIVEGLGVACKGKVWIVCTGQETVDEIIKINENEFSRIQDRFKIRLSLTSSSVDEVIQKRLLGKKLSAEEELKTVYAKMDSTMKNLFHFENALSDIHGYDTEMEFIKFFPFVPYQFIIMPKIFTELRKHGHAGNSTSSGERSMISGFQNVAQKIKDKDQYAVVPLYLFFDTVCPYLESTIIKVINRCKIAAENEKNDAILPQDVDILKLLYLICYIKDIPSTVENIAILMADNIQMDKADKKKQVQASLGRLLNENYIGRIGDTYRFLTNAEQDIAKEIKNTFIDTQTVVNEIQKYIFNDIYEDKKKKYGDYDFDIDKFVDNTSYGVLKGGLNLSFFTVATPEAEKNDAKMILDSNKRAYVVLDDTPYFEQVEQALKIEKLVKQKLSTLPSSEVSGILLRKNTEASELKGLGCTNLETAITNATFYVDGAKISTQGSSAKQKIDDVLNRLVLCVYDKLDAIEHHVKDTKEIKELFEGKVALTEKWELNQQARQLVLEYLDLQKKKNINLSLQELYQRYESIPYGWKELDIAFVIAQLMMDQEVIIKYQGNIIYPNAENIISIMTKRAFQGSAQIIRREKASSVQVKAVQAFLKTFFDEMNVPKDEDCLVGYIVESFGRIKDEYEKILNRYNEEVEYPNKSLVFKSIATIDEVLRCKKDNVALIDCVAKKKEDLLDMQEDMELVKSFFATQADLFKEGYLVLSKLHDEFNYMLNPEDIKKQLNQIREIVHDLQETCVTYDYKQISKLNDLLPEVKKLYAEQLDEKRKDILEIVRQCMEDIHRNADFNHSTKEVSDSADKFYSEKREAIQSSKSMMELEAMVKSLTSRRDNDVSKIESLMKSKVNNPNRSIQNENQEFKQTETRKERVKAISKAVFFVGKEIRTEEDIENYLESVRQKLTNMLTDADCIKIE